MRTSLMIVLGYGRFPQLSAIVRFENYGGHRIAAMFLMPPNVLAYQRLTIADRNGSEGRQWSNGWCSALLGGTWHIVDVHFPCAFSDVKEIAGPATSTFGKMIFVTTSLVISRNCEDGKVAGFAQKCDIVTLRICWNLLT